MSAVRDVAKERVKWIEWLDAINEDSELTKWEEGFIDDLSEKREEVGDGNFWLSERQAEILERIYAEKTG